MNFKLLNILFLRAAALSLPLAATMPCAPADGAPTKPGIIPQIDTRGFTGPVPKIERIETEDLEVDFTQGDIGQMTRDNSYPHTPKDLFECVTKPSHPFTDQELDKVHGTLETIENWLSLNRLVNYTDMKAFLEKAGKHDPDARDVLENKYERFRKYMTVYTFAPEGSRKFLTNNPLQVIEIIGAYYDLTDALAPLLNDKLFGELEAKIDPLLAHIIQLTAEGGREIQDRMNDKCPKLGQDYMKQLSP